jgi:hypothetical protein
MIRGMGPPPPLGDFPHGIDISQPKYMFETEIWCEPPHQFHEEFINLAYVTDRKQNDAIYKTVGNAMTWNRYIVLGFHAYDNCFQFDTQWQKMQQNEGDVLQFNWSVYNYHLSRDLELPAPLESWATDIAKPYLTVNRPAAIEVDTTDPRKARRQYDESDLMEVDDPNTKPKADENWKLVGGKTKSIKNAIQTPLPASPKRTPTPNNPDTPIDVDTPRTDITHIHLNDGTLRITTKWKPTNYDELSEDKPEWNLAATDLIHFMLDTVRDDAIVHPWVASDNTQPIPSLELNPDNILDYIAPKITPMPSIKTFIFSFRVCIGTGPGRWMNNPITKKNMQQHHVTINISNSSSDSGETITTAGYIFYKHPTFTHRFYYLKQLRRKLHESTPFFDIAIHRRTPTGQDIPHLVVKCGDNNVGTLTEILSAHLDGTSTAIFLGRLLISKMTTDEVNMIFKTHGDFVQNTRFLPLSPVVQNVDRLRTEYNSNGNSERSTREWATNLQDEKGNHLKCDAENGGDNRKAQLLVPLSHLELAKKALEAYKERVSPFSQRENIFSNLVSQSQSQEEQYIPTPAANNNLTRIKKLCPTKTWDTSSQTRPTNSTYQPPSNRGPPQNIPPSASKPETPQNTDTPPLKKTYAQASQQINSDDDTATTNSLMTRSLGTTANKYKELEEAIMKQNAAIKEHQTEFKNVNRRFDDLDSRLLQTLTFCKDASQNVLELRQDTTENISGMRQDAIDNVQEFRHSFMEMQQMIQALTTRLDDAMSNRSSSSDSSSSTSEQSEEDTMSCHSTATEKQTPANSPRKKQEKRKRKEKQLDLKTIKQNLNPKPPPDQDKSAQYKEDSTPDAGAT